MLDGVSAQCLEMDKRLRPHSGIYQIPLSRFNRRARVVFFGGDWSGDYRVFDLRDWWDVIPQELNYANHFYFIHLLPARTRLLF